MARKPNYAFERNAKAKAKAEKREAKRQAKLAAKAEKQVPEADDEDRPAGTAADDTAADDTAADGTARRLVD
jgi:hypothetical protein